MEKREFDVLYCIYKNKGISQRRIAASCGISLGSVNKIMQSMMESHYISAAGGVLPAGEVALEPYRVRNAVVLAAGMSTRFVPFSFEKPKGLMVCRGEILIERQIEQLREAGISEIVVVVGYMMEQYFYLKEKYDVTIVVNSEFATRNNNGSIWAARNYLGNSYICASDNYFTENLFESHVYRSFYDSIYAEGALDERGLFFDEDGRIYKTERPTCDKWLMFGRSYWTFDFARQFLEILEREYDEPAIKNALWEWIYDLHIDELDLYVQKNAPNTILEFDSLDDLRLFDDYYVNNTDSGILDNICRVLGCEAHDIHAIEPLKSGITNRSFSFKCGERKYVYRHPGNHDIDRKREAFAQNLAAELGIDNSLVHMNAEEGWKISAFIEEDAPVDFSDPQQLAQVMSLVKVLQDSGKTCEWDFDFWKTAELTVANMGIVGRQRLKPFEGMRARIGELARYLEENPWRRQLCHNDISSPNILFDGEQMSLIDWEFAGNNDIGFDICKPAMRAGLIGVQARKVFAAYFGREISLAEEKHLMACAAVLAWFWFVWDMQNEVQGVNTGDFLLMWHEKARIYSDYALSI